MIYFLTKLSESISSCKILLVQIGSCPFLKDPTDPVRSDKILRIFLLGRKGRGSAKAGNAAA